ncbi:MAG: hypothetical protein ACE5HV_07070 [Acidobacteriota bacterium]
MRSLRALLSLCTPFALLVGIALVAVPSVYPQALGARLRQHGDSLTLLAASDLTSGRNFALAPGEPHEWFHVDYWVFQTPSVARALRVPWPPRRATAPFTVLPAANAAGGNAASASGRSAEPDPSAVLSGLHWRSIGPANMGGRTTAMLGMPGDYKTFWVGTADGGVWKTSNGGTTFEGQWQDEEAYSVGALALAPSDTNVVWLGSGEGDPRNSVSYGLGVWRSTDGGRSWKHLGLEGTERIKRIVVDPRDADVALVCALGHQWGPNEERGVFKTTDGGETWKKVLYIDPDTGCSDLDIDLSNPRNVYAGMWTFRRRPWRFDDGGKETALYKSTDGGDSWKKVTTTPDEPMARIGISVAQSSPNIVYLITEYPTAGTLFRSDDYGETWSMINDDRNLNFRPFYYSDVYVDPSDPNTLFTLSGGLSKSTDGGRTFQRIANGVHGDHQSFWIDPEDSDHLLSGSDGGYQVSHDRGRTFAVINNIPISQFYQIFFDDRDPYYVCGGLQDNGDWCGPSRTNNPAGILKDDWYTVGGGDGFYAVPVPGKPNLVYSNAQGGYFRITDTGSGQTRSIEPYPRNIGSQGQGMFRAKYRFNWDAPIYISPHDAGVVYWGGNVLFKSTDQGYSWQIISPDLTTNDPEKQRDSGGEIYNDNTAAEFHCTILTIAESPLQAGVIWVGTDDGNVQISRDDGAHWMNVKDNLPGLPAETWIAKIDASRYQAGSAYIAVDNHRLNDFTPHAYRCRDFGRSCEDLSAGLPQDDYVKVIREDPRNENLLYVGMDRGIYASWDGGKSWHDIRLNLPRVSVRDIKIQPRENDLIIGTHGRGAWILDDITPLQDLATAMNEELHLFDVRRATRWERWNQDASLGQRSWRGENPPSGALINYWLKEAPSGARDSSTRGAGRGRSGGRLGADASASGGGATRRGSRPGNRGSGAAAAGRSRGAAAGDGGVIIRIRDASGKLVKEWQDHNAHAGVNRAVWDLSWEGPRPLRSRPATGRRFFRFGPTGPPTVPGTYTVSVSAGGKEQSTSFELRGDPNVSTSQADYEAQFEAAMKVRDLTSRVNELIDTVADLNGQLENLNGSLEGSDVDNLEQIIEQTGTAMQQLKEFDNKLQRPFPRMNYRQYPRLSEELRTLNRNIASAQARPTEGQLEVLAELDQETSARIAELDQLISATIEELNQMLIDYPKIIVGSGAGSDR